MNLVTLTKSEDVKLQTNIWPKIESCDLKLLLRKMKTSLFIMFLESNE